MDEDKTLLERLKPYCEESIEIALLIRYLRRNGLMYQFNLHVKGKRCRDFASYLNHIEEVSPFTKEELVVSHFSFMHYLIKEGTGLSFTAIFAKWAKDYVNARDIHVGKPLRENFEKWLIQYRDEEERYHIIEKRLRLH